MTGNNPILTTTNRSTRVADSNVPLGGGVILTLFGLVFLSVGVTLIILQRYRMTTYVSCPATVTSSTVVRRVSHDRHGTHTSYEPVISYFYTVNNSRYSGKRVFPLGSISASYSWAHGIVDQYPAGKATTAWYDPADASKVYLIRRAQWFPHLISLGPALFAWIGVYLIVVSLRNRRPLGPLVSVAPGWFKIAEEGKLRHRLNFSIILTVSWYAYCAIIFADYLTLPNSGPDLFVYIASPICFALGLIGVAQVWRYWRLNHDFLDAVVQISQEKILPNNSMHLRVRLPILRSLQISELAIGLICMSFNRTRTSKGWSYLTAEDWSHWNTLEINHQYNAGAQLDAQNQVTLPPTANPSTPPNTKTYPRYRWHIALSVTTQGQPKLEVRYPVAVLSANTSAV